MNATQTDGGSTTNQKLTDALNALNILKNHGMPDNMYQTALAGLRTSIQSPATPFEQGLKAGGQDQPNTVLPNKFFSPLTIPTLPISEPSPSPQFTPPQTSALLPKLVPGMETLHLMKPTDTSAWVSPEEQDSIDYNNFQAGISGIDNNPNYNEYEKTARKDALTSANNELLGRIEAKRLNADDAARLKGITDQISALDIDISYMKRYGAKYDQIKPYMDKLDALKGQLGTELQGFDKLGYGYGVDPSNVTDIKLNSTAIKSARYQNGIATGDLYEVVNGFGGKVNWESGNRAAVYDAQGNKVSTIYTDKENSIAVERDLNNAIINKYTVVDGRVQADIAGMADKMGVPFSYYHDKNGVFHAYTQNDMKDAPMQVVRREGDVYITANVHFAGNADDLFPGTNFTYAEVAYAGIQSTWGTGRTYNIGGKIKVPDPNDPSKTILVDADPDDKVTVHFQLNCDNKSPNSLMASQANSKDNYAQIVIGNDFFSNMPAALGFTSHNFTEEPLRALVDPFEAIDVQTNALETTQSGQLEQVLYNWSLKNPGMTTLYNNYKGSPYSRHDYAKISAHEFGHMLGLGDAYAAPYREGKRAPLQFVGANGRIYEASDEDMMISDLSKEKPTYTDIYMMLNAFGSGEGQFFPK